MLFLSFLLPVPLFPQAVRLSHFLQGQWHRMQSKPCISLRPWRYCIICPFFVFFVQMMGNGKAALSCVDCSHGNHRPTLSPVRFSFTHSHPSLCSRLTLFPLLSLHLHFLLMTGNVLQRNLPLALQLSFEPLLEQHRSCYRRHSKHTVCGPGGLNTCHSRVAMGTLHLRPLL